MASILNFDFALVSLIIPAAVGALFGSMASLILETRKEQKSKKNLIHLLVIEMDANVKLLLKASKSDEKWPSFLYSDIYKSNLENLYLLEEDHLTHIFQHYKDAQLFENALQIARDRRTHQPKVFASLAHKAYRSGVNALQLLQGYKEIMDN